MKLLEHRTLRVETKLKSMKPSNMQHHAISRHAWKCLEQLQLWLSVGPENPRSYALVCVRHEVFLRMQKIIRLFCARITSL